jgi:hypothetical protein
MKTSFSKGTCGYTIGDLSYWDIVKLMLGREIHVGSSIIRLGIAYQAFNTSAPEAAPKQKQKREDLRAAEQFDGFSDYREKGSDNIPPVPPPEMVNSFLRSIVEPDVDLETDDSYRRRLLKSHGHNGLLPAAVNIASGYRLDAIGNLVDMPRVSDAGAASRD